MKKLGIRDRILLVSLAPALLVGLLVSVVIIHEHGKTMQVKQHQRLYAIARQLAAAAEYNLFVGNEDALRRLIEAAKKEPDVIGGAIFDARGNLLVSSVPLSALPSPQEIPPGFDPPVLPEKTLHWHRQPIEATLLEGDVFDFGFPTDPSSREVGQLLLQVSNSSLDRAMAAFAVKAMAVTALILLLAALLALGMARGLVRTLEDISRVVMSIRQGRHTARTRPAGDDELGHLAQGINTLAEEVGQTHDMLTERVQQATEALRRERDEAHEAAEARSRFFAAASHDLRQPVQALGLFAARLTHDAADTPFLARVAPLEKSVQNLQDLLDTLLDYSRLSGRVVPIEMRPIHTGELFPRLIEEFGPAAAEKDLALRLRVAEGWLMTDRALLYRILINFVSNAIRHTRTGAVLIGCRRGATHARIEVWDTGPGIPPEAQAMIFEELVQLDNPERDRDKGLGLGLAIVRRTADLLHHPIRLCSRVGRGARFSVVVPLAPEPAPEALTARGERPVAVPDPLDGSCVMIVAADPARQAELSAQLHAWNCQTFIVSDFAEAATWLADNSAPECILWDVGTRGIAAAHASINRLEAAMRLPIPSILLTTGPGPKLSFSPSGAPRLVLSQPFRPARLRALLARAMDPGE